MNKKTIAGKISRACLLMPALLLLSKISVAATEQVSTAPVKMDGVMWSNGKIYVVVLVLATIFLGIIITLFFIERKIKRLERKVEQKALS